MHCSPSGTVRHFVFVGFSNNPNRFPHMPNKLFRSASIVFLTLLILLGWNSTLAAEEPRIPERQTEVLTRLLPTESVEVKILAKQLEDSRKFQEQILSTVYWSLGTLAGVAVLLVGFGWLANFRIFEREKAALERELRAQVNQEISGLRQQVAEIAAGNVAKLEISLSEQMVAAREGLLGNSKKLVDTLEVSISSRILAKEAMLRSLHDDVLSLKLEHFISKRVSWQEKKIARNVLQASVSALVIANTIDYENTVAEVLDLVATDIGAIHSAKATPIDNYLVAQLIAALDAVKGSHAHAAATLKTAAGALLSK
jgi:hypothetical protein